MTPDKLPSPRQETCAVEIDASDSEGLPLLHEVALRYVRDADEVLIGHSGNWQACTPRQDSRETLMDVLQADIPRVAVVSRVASHKTGKQLVTLLLSLFPNVLDWPPQAFEIGVDDKIAPKIRSRQYLDKPTASVEEVMAWLSEVLLCPDPQLPGTFRAAISYGRTRSQRESAVASFTIWGDRIVADIALQPDGRLRIENLVKGRQKDDRGLSLLQASITFHDASQAAAFRHEALNQLKAITAQADSYLGLWRRYNNLEREIILRRARDVGIFRFSRFDSRAGRLEFTVELDQTSRPLFDKLSPGDDNDFDASTVRPQVIEQPRPDEPLQQQIKELQRINVGKLAEIDVGNHRLMFEHDDPDQVMDVLPAKGYLYASLGGDTRRLQRRDEAEARIREAANPMPQLGLLLENMPVAQGRYKRHKPISAKSRKLFADAPTPRQLEALDVALNTPDIALIQGPPGTGKTQVIAALQAQLAKIGEHDDALAGQILLTSYQHDAVVQAASRTEVYGLPAINLSRRKGKAMGDGFEAWRTEAAQAVRGRLSQLDGSKYSSLMQLRQRAWAHMRQPARPEDSITLLSDVEEASEGGLPAELRSRIAARIGVLRRIAVNLDVENDDSQPVLKAVLGLRTTPEAFSDDGPDQAYKALSRARQAGMLNERETSLLEEAAEWDSDDAPPFLEDLGQLKISLADRIASSKASKRPDFNDEATRALLAESVAELDRVLGESKSGAAAVLTDYLSDLENDPDSIRSALAEYTVVLAATCQQADSKEIWAAKNDSPVFETVIIDEAARANPLDLLIPMSMAKRRIVLVGDHRQLPQILDEEVQRAVQSDRSNPDLDPLRESLFERLFRNLKEREARDGVKRTVTLDKQYRMHPKLGSFVSRCFYEAFGDPKIDSGKDDNEFLHALPGYVGRVAAWLSVPEGRGREKHAGHSWARQSEAEAVAKELARLIEASPDMSIGIISFYGAQIAEIWRQLEQLGLAIRDADGYRIIQKYRYATDHMGRQAERVQIGTVDSFQGKEFDVVILSLTRCNSHKPSADEEALRRKYGFLTLINRLCVAMSRQRRLLIVAGDEKMAEDIPDGVPSLAPLREFLAMTRSDDGRI
jgi:hypothetical protein